MNDRYLYRAKRTDNGEFVEGFLANGKWYFGGKEICAILPLDLCFFPHCEISEWIEIDPSTICQCTGLKDKNGNLIWENDILSIAKSVDVIYGNYFYPTIPYPANVKVKWDFCAWMWETIAKNKHYIGFPDAWCHYEAEVVGNIFDNPELLEK